MALENRLNTRLDAARILAIEINSVGALRAGAGFVLELITIGQVLGTFSRRFYFE